MCVVKVSGVLGFVLHLSRIMGISHISLKRCENGFDASFSYATALSYGYFSFILANLLGIVGFIFEVIFNNRFPTENILNISINIISCVLLSCNAKAKTKLMLKHLTILNKINTNLLIKDRLLEKKYFAALCMGCVVFLFSLTSLTFIKYVFVAQNLSDYIPLLIIYANLQILAFETLMITLKYNVYKALKNLTRELRNHLRLMKFVCKVVDEMNEKDGKINIFIMTSLLFYTVYATCDILHRTTRDSKVVLICFLYLDNTVDILYDVLWIASFVIRLYIILEPCHQIAEETGEIHVLFSKLICCTTRAGKPCSWEWDLILFQLYLLEPTFSPFGMLTLDRTLFTSIISVTTTYLAIAIPHTKVLYKNMTFL